jgi:hypothetical protein
VTSASARPVASRARVLSVCSLLARIGTLGMPCDAGRVPYWAVGAWVAVVVVRVIGRQTRFTLSDFVGHLGHLEATRRRTRSCRAKRAQTANAVNADGGAAFEVAFGSPPLGRSRLLPRPQLPRAAL